MKLLVTSDKEKGIDHLLIVTTMTSDVLYLFLVRSIKINANINISTISLQLHKSSALNWYPLLYYL